MQAGAHQCHLLVEGIQQGASFRRRQAAAQQLAALAQQPAVAAQKGAVDGLKLQHHPVEPLAALGGFPPHQLQIQGAEPHAPQRPDQVDQTLQAAAVSQGPATTATPQLQFQLVPFARAGP